MSDPVLRAGERVVVVNPRTGCRGVTLEDAYERDPRFDRVRVQWDDGEQSQPLVRLLRAEGTVAPMDLRSKPGPAA